LTLSACGRNEERQAATESTAPASAPDWRAGVASLPKEQSEASSTAALFQRLDTDRDGYISENEARGSPGVELNFAEMDEDKDGKLSRSEIQMAGLAGPAGPAGEPGGMNR
jgi:hypothetical protein